MLQPIYDLPGDILGVRASHKVSKEDYDRVVAPKLEAASRAGRRIRLLYAFERDFRGFTASGVWEDARLGQRILGLLERCAVLSDSRWVRQISGALAQIVPFPLRVFKSAERDAALAWLDAPASSTALACRLVGERGVLLVEAHGSLTAEDFDVLAAAVDPWVAEHGGLRGLVVHARQFPGWASVGSLWRHVRFLRKHHKVVGRIGVVADGFIAEAVPGVLEQLLHPKIRHFSYEELEHALAWAACSADDLTEDVPDRAQSAPALGGEARP